MMGELQSISVERLCHLAGGFRNACVEQDIMSNLDEAVELPWLSKHKLWCSNRIVGLRIAQTSTAHPQRSPRLCITDLQQE
ncbi:hypothetical protein BDR05DRAFT_961191 [Suillus weaverae]|nr:hypothetical protein BDR05DRAFT_961191 [Suillus weaverae]